MKRIRFRQIKGRGMALAGELVRRGRGKRNGGSGGSESCRKEEKDPGVWMCRTKEPALIIG